jgi:hypothetical protein
LINEKLHWFVEVGRLKCNDYKLVTEKMSRAVRMFPGNCLLYGVEIMSPGKKKKYGERKK